MCDSPAMWLIEREPKQGSQPTSQRPPHYAAEAPVILAIAQVCCDQAEDDRREYVGNCGGLQNPFFALTLVVGALLDERIAGLVT